MKLQRLHAAHVIFAPMPVRNTVKSTNNLCVHELSGAGLSGKMGREVSVAVTMRRWIKTRSGKKSRPTVRISHLSAFM